MDCDAVLTRASAVPSGQILKDINRKDVGTVVLMRILCNTGNCIRCSLVTYMERKSKKRGGMCVRNS